ncbi:MAG: DUF3362 domain-containing protein [Candidatus Sedimenticola endophacoides]
MQAFLPTPLAVASAMYHTGLNPLRRISRRGGGWRCRGGSGSDACTRRSCAITMPKTGPCCARR